MNRLNCWINQTGDVRPVRAGAHAVERKRGDVIRVSSPERRRTWLGIEVSGKATEAARAACKGIVRDARRQSVDIIADIDGRIIEVMRYDRPTQLNKALS